MRALKSIASLVAALILGVLLAASGSAATTGTWTPLANPAPDVITTMLLMTDGSVLAQDSDGTAWYRLTPDAHGSYAHGTWSAVAPMHDSRLYYASVVMRDGRVLVGGGEYGTGGQTVEIYDPVANAWTELASWNSGFGNPLGDNVGIDDSTAKVTDDGRVLLCPFLSRCGYLYDPHLDAWTQTANKLSESRNDEESVVHMANGDFFQSNIWDAAPHGSQRYNPATNTWISCGSTPGVLPDSKFEMGPCSLLYDGRILCLGATGQTAIYTPPASDPTDVAAGSWIAGPIMPNSPTTGTPFGCDDAPSAVMPNGRVLFIADSGGANFSPPTACFEFDPATNTIASAPSPSAALTNASAYINRMLMLPSGEVLLSTSSQELYLYAPSGTAQGAWRPTISSIVDQHNGTFSLTGTQLNGLSEGACYGDDAQMATNYPSVTLTDGAGNVYFATTNGFSTMGVATGSASVSAIFNPGRAPNGSYSLAVIANGISSSTVPFTLNRSTSAPAFTTVAPTTALVNATYSYQAGASGQPAPTFALATAPVGMAIDATSGYITWTPTAGGVFPVTVSASNGIAPDAAQSFTITASAAPAFTSIAPTTAVVGQALRYAASASGYPAPTYSLSVAPAGMSIDGASGALTWTPLSTGHATATIIAANGVAPNATQVMTLNVLAAPIITSTAVSTVHVNQPYSYAVTASGTPTPTFQLSVGAAGMSINATTGVISWTPTAAGPYPGITVMAVNGVSPSASQTFTIGVTAAPLFISAPPATAVVGQPYPYTATASGYPAPTFSLSGAPAGMTIDTTSGAITWTPTAAGTVTATITAANGIVPAATQALSITVNAAPTITSTPIASVVVGHPYRYTVTATGAPTPTFSLSVAPAGMTIDATTGAIAWNPTVVGIYSTIIVASNGIVPSATQTIQLTVTEAPTITSTPPATVLLGQTYTYQVVATAFPNPTFTLSGAPAGMSVSIYGDINWTPTSAGTFTATVTVDDGVPPAATQLITITVQAPPHITSTPIISTGVNLPYACTVTATGVPAPTYALSTAPAGMAINATSGAITWTPTVTGSYPVTVVASNGVSPDATQSYTLSVTRAPLITSTPITSVGVGTAYAYTVTATGFPAPTFSLAASPAGMAIDAATGAITWTPSIAGSFAVTVVASNGIAPAASQSYTIGVTQAPIITSTPNASVGVGTAYAYTVTASGFPAPTFSLSAPPAGMSISAATGAITWTPSVTGSYAATVVATNGIAPAATQHFTISVTASPQITSSAPTVAIVGQPFAYQVVATGYPAPTFTLTGAPAGMTIGASSGLISWTPSSAGPVTATITASNGVVPNATQHISLTVTAAPVITSSAVTSVMLGSSYAYTVTASGAPAPGFQLGSAPAGMSIDAVTGAIAWTPAATGSYAVTVTASNGTLPNATQSFSISVDLAPTFTSTPPTTATVGQAYTCTESVSAYPAATLALTLAPSGLTMSSAGVIGWTPTASGTFQVTVTANNGILPAGTQTFSIVVSAGTTSTTGTATTGTATTGTATTGTATTGTATSSATSSGASGSTATGAGGTGGSGGGVGCGMGTGGPGALIMLFLLAWRRRQAAACRPSER